jgi:peptidoglycan/LPS O-acetylase OafA/YrhL
MGSDVQGVSLSIAGNVVLALLVALVGVVAGLGALLGAAAITDRPPLFLLAGLLALCVACLLGLLLVPLKVNATRRRVRLISFCAGTALIVGAFARGPTPRSRATSSSRWARSSPTSTTSTASSALPTAPRP